MYTLHVYSFFKNKQITKKYEYKLQAQAQRMSCEIQIPYPGVVGTLSSKWRK
jgi:hypothetical protein